MKIKLKIDIRDSAEDVLSKLKTKLDALINAGEENFDLDYAIINGIKLERKNKALKYCSYFSFDESLWLAEARNLRLPSKEEWVKMLEPGSTWDAGKKGLWIGENHRLKKETKYSTFLPAAGYRDVDNSSLTTQGTIGYYWSSTPYGSNAYILTFISNCVCLDLDCNRSDGFSVRCVAEN